MADLTPKQARFVEEYLIDLNATQAAIRAGYSPRSAKQVAALNMTKHDIKAAIDEGKKARSKRTLITQDEVVIGLKQLAASNVLDFTDVSRDGKSLELNLHKMTREQALWTAAGLMIYKVHREDSVKHAAATAATLEF